MTRHPAEDRLIRWLESGKPRRVGRHIEACDVCLERVEAVSDLGGGLRSELESASAPPDDLQLRTTGGVQGRLASEEAVVAWLELFSVPWQTAATLLEIDPITPRREPSPLQQNDQHHVPDDHPFDDDATDDEEHADG